MIPLPRGGGRRSALRPAAKQVWKGEMNMKKLLTLAMAAVMALSLAACGGSGASSAPAASAPAAPAAKTTGSEVDLDIMVDE